MSIETENSAKLRDIWARWSESKGTDPGMWRAVMTDDVRLFSLADGREPLGFTATRQGIDDVEAYLGGLTGSFDMNHWQIDETVAEGDRVAAIGSTSWTHKVTGKSFSTQIAILTRWRDGRIYEYREYYDTAAISACAC